MTNSLSEKPNTGILLVNLGTPKSTELADIKAYLSEFLNDPYVIDLPAPLRWFLVNVIILNVRSPKTRHAYQAVWTDAGSPLLVISRRFEARFREYAKSAGFTGPIEMGMRYAQPSLSAAVARLRAQGAKRIVTLPLYPQYALSSTETVLAKLKAIFKDLKLKESDLSSVPAFYDDADFIKCLAQSVRDSGAMERADHLMMSFHGLPERHVKKTDGENGKYCLSSTSCCDRITDKNKNCYRAQSFQTARLLARELGLRSDQWSISFQSRLTRKWIQPFTDKTLEAFPGRGIKKVAVICPSFVTDCLETLEEIGIRAKEDFVAAGGEHLELIPCLNDRADWVQAAWGLVGGSSR